MTGTFADLGEGTHYPRADSVIARMIDGAPAAAAGVGPGHPAADTAEHRQLGVHSYLAMPVIPTDGRLLGFLVGLDHGEVSVSADTLALVRAIADALAATGDIPAPPPPAVSPNGPRPGDRSREAGGSAGQASVGGGGAVGEGGAVGATDEERPAPAARAAREQTATREETPAQPGPTPGGEQRSTPAALSPGAAPIPGGGDSRHGDASPDSDTSPSTDTPRSSDEGSRGGEASPGNGGPTRDERPAGGERPASGPVAHGAAAESPPPAGPSRPPRSATPGIGERAEPAAAPPTPPRPPGRVPTPQALARAVRPGPPGRAGPPRPTPPPATGTGPAGTGAQVTGAARPAPAVSRRSTADMRLRRTPAGWVVEGPGAEIRPVGDLLSAMVLADLLAEDLAPPGRPRRAERDLGEIEQLRLSVVQLEHALASRVIVEQAIGVLAERHQIRPREAFERLRRTARGMGRRVHDLARQVVDSVGDPRAVLPGELGGRGGPAGGGPSGATPGPGPGPGGAPRPAPPRSTSGRH
ncbi:MULTISPECIES: GAF and ANTAR domain-containing protein [Frankia]|uniref:GAF and ANTAR domain-containing protein n=1 Tax=Frankia TaxID=1854 RepID=UPI00032424DA|nr:MULTISPECIES: GAF and ANTAR domain-containing protein [Frankia]